MSLLQNSNVVTPSGYNIDYSMRMPDATSSAKLYRTLTSAGSSSPKWTFATWYKKGSPTTSVKSLLWFQCKSIHANATWHLGFQNDVINYGGGVRMNIWSAHVSQSDWDTDNNAGTTAGLAFRDYADWFHFCHIIDYQTSPYVFMYINGVLQDPDWIYGGKSGPGYGTNYAPLTGNEMRVGSSDGSDTGNGYFADTYFIEGQNLPPIGNFLEVDDLTNETKAIEYEGTYTGNSFYFDYADSSDFGKDQSGLGNHFTSTSLGTQEQTIDTPQNNVGSNFAVWNPLWGRANKMPVLTRGCRGAKSPDAAQSPCTATFGSLVDGKWYWEILPDSKGGSDCQLGIINTSAEMVDVAQSQTYYRFYLADTGNKWTDTNASTISYGNTWTQGDIIGVALDMDNGAIYFSKNGTWQDSGVPTSGSTKTGAAFTDVLSAIPAGGRYGGNGWVPAVLSNDTTVEYVCNFGQDSSFDNLKTSGSAEAADGSGKGNFFYTPPSGFLALCQDNLPTPSIKLPREHYKTNRWAGNGSSQTITTGFQTDFAWVKRRNATSYHILTNSVSGAGNYLVSNTQDGESSGGSQLINALSSTGFTVGNEAAVNASGGQYVGWTWKAGGSVSAGNNTDGTLASTVSANVAAGFSIVKFTGTGSAFTVGHGLSQAPEMIIAKSAASSTNWPVYGGASTGPTNILYFNLSNALGTDAGSFTSIDASTIGIGTTTDLNQNATDCYLWCFHSVPGYSKIGNCKLLGSSPSGNDGTYIDLGFKPAFFYWKMTTTSHAGTIYDRSLTNTGTPAGEPHNVGNVYLVPSYNYSDQQYRTTPMIGWDYLSNGVKQRQNYSTDTMQYLAFAHQPFKYSRGG